MFLKQDKSYSMGSVKFSTSWKTFTLCKLR